MKVMSAQRKKWMDRLDVISSWTDSVPGHAMLCAAGMCYLPSVPPDRHKDMMENWLGYCSGVVPLGRLASEQGSLQPTQVSPTPNSLGSRDAIQMCPEIRTSL